MRFLLRRNNRNNNNNTNNSNNRRRKQRRPVKELEADLKELIETVLPCFQNRPSLYNEIAREAQQLNHDIHQAMKGSNDDNAVAADNDSTAANGEATSASIQFLEPTNPTSLPELQKDRMVLDQLLEIPQRRYVRYTVLATIRKQIQSDIDACHAIRTAKATETLERFQTDKALLSFVLRTIQDRPHIYRQLQNEMAGGDEDDDDELGSVVPTKTHRKRLGSSGTATDNDDDEESLNSSFSNVSIGDSTHALSVDSSSAPSEGGGDATTTVIDTTPTAADRWEDVSRIDELIDIVPETSLILYVVLRNLKEAYREEAKALQRVETPLQNTTAALLEAVVDSEERPTTTTSPLLGRPEYFTAEIWA